MNKICFWSSNEWLFTEQNGIILQISHLHIVSGRLPPLSDSGSQHAWQHNSTSPHHSAVNNLTGHLNCSRQGQLLQNLCLTGGLCMKSCKTYELLIGCPLQREVHTQRRADLFACVRLCWTKADGLLTHSHYTGIMLLLAPSGWLPFLYLTHTLPHILLSETHRVFDYDSVIWNKRDAFSFSFPFFNLKVKIVLWASHFPWNHFNLYISSQHNCHVNWDCNAIFYHADACNLLLST